MRHIRFIPNVIAFLGHDPYDTQSGSLGKRLVARRRGTGLSQKELAHRAPLRLDSRSIRLHNAGISASGSFGLVSKRSV